MDIKLVGIIESVNQKEDKNLIGQIVVVHPILTYSSDYELCYIETLGNHYDNRTFSQDFSILHSVLNIEIMGVL